jgi:3-hydroxyacyl-CoA dehydrogenase / enoyl-CoA hydratase / 3-hydroxybutyryl-CoA epimerase
MEGAKKAAPEAAPLPVSRLAVVGAGIMGGGIAHLAAQQGIAVRLKDIDASAVGAGLRHARSLVDGAVRRRRVDRREAAAIMDRISPTLEYRGFGAVELVIEAVVERMDVKKQVLREVEEQTAVACVLTSNTSALSITEMQSVLARPERFCGMHFFNPVHRMPLVEVVRGGATGEEALATAFAAARALGKTPVIVKDGPGFLVNRLLAPYLNEAGWLLEDGAAIDAVDRALLDFGMPMGPFRLLDEVGLDVSRHVAEILHDGFGERMRPAPALAALPDTGRLGKKGGKGFYRHGGKKEEVDEAIYRELGGAAARPRREVPAAEIQERCVLIMVNEAALALADDIVAGPGDVDLAMITGTGFPPFRGGLLRHADQLGTAHVLARMEALEARFGERFRPAPMLRLLGDAGRGFYD